MGYSSIVESIVDPSNAEGLQLDVVFVHGLSNRWQKTWTSSENSRSWLEHLLPHEFPNAHIWTGGFDARNDIQKDQLAFKASCDRLLIEFEEKTSKAQKPVVFVAHSLGGIILQQALQRCSASLHRRTLGIMFLGSPNFGTHETRWVAFTRAIDKIMGSTSSTGLPRNERLSLSRLGSINVKFNTWLPGQIFARRVVCFYETLPTAKAGVVVEEQFAFIRDCDATALDADHLSIAKFPADSKTNTSYQAVVQSFRSMLCLASEKNLVLFRHSWGPASGRLKQLPATPDCCEEFLISSQGKPMARTMGMLALVLEDQGYYKEAFENYSQAANSFETSLGSDHHLALFCLNKKSHLLCNGGKYEKAEHLSTYVVEARIKTLGRSAVTTLLSCSNLALAMRHRHEHQIVQGLLRDALECTNRFFPQIIARVSLLNVLAKATMERDSIDIAEHIACEVVRMSISLYGKGHPFTLNCMSDLATVLAWNKSVTSAEAIARYALEGLEEALGTHHPHSLRTSQRLAVIISFQGRYNEASTQLKHTLEAQEKRLESNHPDILLTMSSLGSVYASQGYRTNAEILLADAYNRQKEALGIEHPSTIHTGGVLESLKTQHTAPSYYDNGPIASFSSKSRPSCQKDDQVEQHKDRLFTSPAEDNIITAAREGIIHKIKTFIHDDSVDLHTAGRALREAAAHGQLMVLELLIAARTPIDEPGGFYGTPLSAASFSGNIDIVEFLLGQKANINVEGGIFSNAILAAIIGRHAEVVALLLDYPYKSAISAKVLDSCLRMAIAVEHQSIALRLLKAGANINAEDNLFGSPLQQASFFGQVDMMKLLLSQPEILVDLQGGIFGSPLEAALRAGRRSAVELLFQSKVSLRPLCSKVDTEDAGAFETSYGEIIAKILLDRMEDFPQVSADGTEIQSSSFMPTPYSAFA